MVFVAKVLMNSENVVGKISNILKKLGPGLLFAGAAIGVSHLVQSTKSGADFGLGLIWALLIANLFKYPFFQYGPKYALATGESMLHGYKKLSRSILIVYFILTIATMFSIQTARKDLQQHSCSRVVTLPYPTNSSFVLNNYALKAIENMFQDKIDYKKASRQSN